MRWTICGRRDVRRSRGLSSLRDPRTLSSSHWQSPQMDWLILCVVIVTSLIQILSVCLTGIAPLWWLTRAYSLALFPASCSGSLSLNSNIFTRLAAYLCYSNFVVLVICRSLSKTVVLSSGDFRDDAGICRQVWLLLGEHVAGCGDELSLVVCTKDKEQTWVNKEICKAHQIVKWLFFDSWAAMISLNLIKNYSYKTDIGSQKTTLWTSLVTQILILKFFLTFYHQWQSGMSFCRASRR